MSHRFLAYLKETKHLPFLLVEVHRTHIMAKYPRLLSSGQKVNITTMELISNRVLEKWKYSRVLEKWPQLYSSYIHGPMFNGEDTIFWASSIQVKAPCATWRRHVLFSEADIKLLSSLPVFTPNISACTCCLTPSLEKEKKFVLKSWVQKCGKGPI